MWSSPTTKSLDPIIVTALWVCFPRESHGLATCGFACNCPEPEAWTTEASEQSKVNTDFFVKQNVIYLVVLFVIFFFFFYQFQCSWFWLCRLKVTTDPRTFWRMNVEVCGATFPASVFKDGKIYEVVFMWLFFIHEFF